jgi:micrococcal nuclease
MNLRTASVVLVAALLVAVPVVVVGAEYPETVSGSVERVVDGDGLYVVGYDRQIRLWGIDAPERSDAGYTEATDHLRRITDGHEVRCNKRDVDRYGRLVGQCFLPDGTDLGAAMIEAGHSVEYCSFSRGFYGTCD